MLIYCFCLVISALAWLIIVYCCQFHSTIFPLGILDFKTTLFSANNIFNLIIVLGFVSQTETSGTQKTSGAESSFCASNGTSELQPRQAEDAQLSSIGRNEVLEEKQTVISKTVARVEPVKPNNSGAHPAKSVSNNSVIGVYSSSTDPVHVPSPDSRSSSTVGAIKREVGVVGGRRLSLENPVKDSSVQSGSFSNSLLGRDSSESFQPFSAISKTDQLSQTTVTESVIPTSSVSRSFLSNPYGSRIHQQVGGHQKGIHLNHECWDIL